MVYMFVNWNITWLYSDSVMLHILKPACLMYPLQSAAVAVLSAIVVMKLDYLQG